jgi:hypothetical protein
MKQETYRIEIKGSLDADWLQWFEGFSLAVTPQGNTNICVRVADQSALHGLLAKIRNLNLVLLSVNHLNDDEIENEK